MFIRITEAQYQYCKTLKNQAPMPNTLSFDEVLNHFNIIKAEISDLTDTQLMILFVLVREPQVNFTAHVLHERVRESLKDKQDYSIEQLYPDREKLLDLGLLYLEGSCVKPCFSGAAVDSSLGKKRKYNEEEAVEASKKRHYEIEDLRVKYIVLHQEYGRLRASYEDLRLCYEAVVESMAMGNIKMMAAIGSLEKRQDTTDQALQALAQETGLPQMTALDLMCTLRQRDNSLDSIDGLMLQPNTENTEQFISQAATPNNSAASRRPSTSSFFYSQLGEVVLSTPIEADDTNVTLLETLKHREQDDIDDKSENFLL